MKKFLLFSIPVLLLVSVVVTTAHAWYATALCQRFGTASNGSNTAHAQAGSFGLQYGHVYAYALVDQRRDESRSFYSNTVSASAYDDGPYSRMGDALSNVHGWNPRLNRYCAMQESDYN